MNFAEDNKSVTESLDIVTADVVKYMIRTGLTLCTAESCTGGMVAEKITSVAGASKMFLGGVCSYTEEIKMKILGVKKETLEKYTVYSEQTASEMSLGALRLFGADTSVGITGLAGPDGGSEEKPVGTVYVSVRNRNKEIVRNLKLYESCENLTREIIRKLTVIKALEMVMELWEEKTRREDYVNG